MVNLQAQSIYIAYVQRNEFILMSTLIMALGEASEIFTDMDLFASVSVVTMHPTTTTNSDADLCRLGNDS